jgi:hypothetical protein
MYLSAQSGAGAIPGAKLVAAEPAAPWVRQGRLVRDQVVWNVPDPGFMDALVGFNQSLDFRIVNKAEIPSFSAPLDETDPDVQNRLRGNAALGATTLSSGAYTGYSFIYQAGQFYSARVLLIGTSPVNATERHIFGARAFVTFKPTTTVDGLETIDVMVAMANDSSGNAYKINDWA